MTDPMTRTPEHFKEPKVLSASVYARDEKAFTYILDKARKVEGNLVQLAEQLGVPLRTVWNWRKRVPELEKQLGEIVPSRSENMKRLNAARAEANAKKPKKAQAKKTAKKTGAKRAVAAGEKTT